MTINIDNKTWVRNPSQVSGGRFYSDVDKVPAADVLTINGTGFGTGPDVILFHRFDGTPDADVALTDPEIGEWTNSPQVNEVTYYTEGSRTFGMTGSGTSGHPLGLRQMRKTFTATQQFRVAFRYGVPTGYRWPTGTLSGGANTGTSHTKLCWFGNSSGPGDDGTGGGDGYADLVTPTFNGSASEIGGNSISLASGKRAFLSSEQIAGLTPGNTALMSYHQRPVSGDPYNTSGHTHRFAVGAALGTNLNTVVACSPYGLTDVGVEDYNAVRLPGWCGNDSSAEVREIFADFYLATGDNCGKMIVLHDASTIAASDIAYIVPPASWSNTSIETITLSAREKLAYYTVLDDSAGTLSTGATGW